jgi:hypothetical protein
VLALSEGAGQAFPVGYAWPFSTRQIVALSVLQQPRREGRIFGYASFIGQLICPHHHAPVGPQVRQEQRPCPAQAFLPFRMHQMP